MSGAAAARVIVEEDDDADAEAVVMRDAEGGREAGRVRWRLRDRFTAFTLHCTVTLASSISLVLLRY